MHEIPTCTYLESCKGTIGALVISELVLPKDTRFDPLAKIWSSVRKRIREEYELDVAGLFVYDDSEAVIYCSFYLSFTLSEQKKIPIKLYIDRFEKTFGLQMAMFEEAIEAFLLDPDDGYEAYCKLVQHCPADDKKAYDKLFNRFLRKVNLKKPGDNRKK